MNKTQLIDELSAKVGVSKRVAGDMLNAFVDCVVASVAKGEDVRITGFGTFKRVSRAARTGVNPQNPSQKIQIKASKSVSFKVGKAAKQAVNK